MYPGRSRPLLSCHPLWGNLRKRICLYASERRRLMMKQFMNPALLSEASMTKRKSARLPVPIQL